MGDRIVEALWDCPYCGQKRIGGLTKHCPGCGQPQSTNTVFYMGEKKNYVDADRAKNYGKGADWMCDYCGSLNRYDQTSCSNCGAEREEAKGDYFSNKTQDGSQTVPKKQHFDPAPAPAPKKGFPKILLLGLLAIIAVITFFALPKKHDVSITSKEWAREISIEAYKTLQESDWTVPEGGRVTDQKSELHHYDKVLDHYEYVDVQRTRTVPNGSHTETTYSNNGDGTFTEHTREVTDYTTETYYETEKRPVYRDEPRYQTKYYYDIDRWVPERTVDTSGGEDEPYWGKPELASNERESGREEIYVLHMKDNKKDKEYSYTCSSLEEWNNYKSGDGITIVVQGGKVKEIQ